MEQAINKWANKVKAQAQKEFDDVQDPVENKDLFKDPHIAELAKNLILKYGREEIQRAYGERIEYYVFMEGVQPDNDVLHGYWLAMQKEYEVLNKFSAQFE